VKTSRTRRTAEGERNKREKLPTQGLGKQSGNADDRAQEKKQEKRRTEVTQPKIKKLRQIYTK